MVGPKGNINQKVPKSDFQSEFSKDHQNFSTFQNIFLILLQFMPFFAEIIAEIR